MMLFPREPSDSFVAIFLFLLLCIIIVVKVIGENRLQKMLYIETLHLGQLPFTLKPTFHAWVCGIISVNLHFNLHSTCIFIGWSSDWFDDKQYIFRNSSCSLFFSHWLRGAGLQAQNWDRHCLCLCFISLSADHQESKQPVMKFALQTM